MKKILTLAVCLTIVLSLMTSIPLARAEEKVTLTFLSHIYKPWNDKLTEQAKAFEKENPNVKIIYSTVPHADLNTKILTGLSAGTAPDVIGVYGPWMVQLVENDWIAPAPDYVVQDIKENTVEIAGSSAEYGDEIYAYVQHIGIPTPVINERLYEEAGVKPPTTYDELLEVNKVLDKYDEKGRMIQAGTTLATTISGSWNVIHWTALLFGMNGEFLNPDNTAVAFNSPAGIKATELYTKLAHPKFLSDAFILEKSAMEWNGPWTRSFYQENNPNLRYKALPPLKGERQVDSMYVWFWVVSSEAKGAKYDAAWKFNHFMSNDDNYLDMAKTIGFVTFRKANFEDPEFRDDPWINAFRSALEHAQIYYSRVPIWEKVDVLIGRELERILAEELTIEEGLKTAEEKINKELASM